MKRLLTVFIIWLLALLSTPNLGAFSGELDTPVEDKVNSAESWREGDLGYKKVETIKELKENINELEWEKRQLKDEWQQFLIENGEIQDLLKDDIAEEDESKLKEIIDLYGVYKAKLDNDLEDTENDEQYNEIKQELLKLKQDLYKKLVYFIKVEKLDDFLTYVRWDLSVNEKRKDVSKEISEDKKKLEEKVQVIREKIEENKKVLEERIRIVIEKKLDEKISKILSDERFTRLSEDKKKQMFLITLEKLRIKRLELTSLTEKTSLVDKQIETYNIIEEKLLEVMEWFESVDAEQ